MISRYVTRICSGARFFNSRVSLHYAVIFSYPLHVLLCYIIGI